MSIGTEYLATAGDRMKLLNCPTRLLSNSLNCVRLTLYSFSMRGISVCGFQSNVRLKTALRDSQLLFVQMVSDSLWNRICAVRFCFNSGIILSETYDLNLEI